MKGMENLFSRQPFICVCVFVPPGSVLQISQLCETLTRVESTRFLRQILCGEHTPLRRVFFTLLSSLDLSSLSLSSCLPLSLQGHSTPPPSPSPSLCLNGEHHSRTNDAPLLCSMLPSSASAWLHHFHTHTRRVGDSEKAARKALQTHIDDISAVHNDSGTRSSPVMARTSTLHASAKAKPSLGTECIQAPQVTSSFLIKKKQKTRPIYFSFAVSPQ